MKFLGRLPALPSLAIASLFALATFALHHRWIQADFSIPLGDEPGHLLNMIRWLQWLQGAQAPAEAHPPGLYLVSALIADFFKEGDRLKLLKYGPALYGCLLVGGMSWLGARSYGLLGALWLGFLTLSSPQILGFSRLFLLDLPMTSVMVLIWISVLESEHFSKPLPTLLLGVTLAWGLLTKYTIVLWVAPLLLYAGLRLLLSTPSALLPLLLVPYPLYQILKTLVAVGATWRPGFSFASTYTSLYQSLEIASALLLVLACLGWWKSQTGLVRGSMLGLAALLCAALVLPWGLWSCNAVYIKLMQEAVNEVRITEPGLVKLQGWLFVRSSWPSTWELLWLGIGAELGGGLLYLAGFRWERLKTEVQPGLSLPLLGLVLGATGFTLIFKNLPFDTRYVLPVLPCVILVLGGLLRLRLSQLLLVPLGCLMALLQLFSGKPVRLTSLGLVSQKQITHTSLIAPVAPIKKPLFTELQTMLRQTLPPLIKGCPALELKTLSLNEARPLGLEDRGIQVLVLLEGFKECIWVKPGQEAPLVVSVGGMPVEGAEVITEQTIDGLRLGIYRRSP